MAKVLRSIRIDDSIFAYIDSYNDLRVRLGLSRLPIGDVLADSVRMYISEQMVALKRQASAVAQDADRLADVGNVFNNAGLVA